MARRVAAWTGLALLAFSLIGLRGLDPARYPSLAVPITGAKILTANSPPRTDLVQDMVGARRLFRGEDPYPPLGPANVELGLPPKAEQDRSPHPPTAFLLTSVVAWMSWSWASMVWGWFVVLLVSGVLKILRVPAWVICAAMPAVLFWPPMFFSIGQLTPVWLFAGVAALKWRDRAFVAGALVGIATATKGLASVLLLPLLTRRRSLRGVKPSPAPGRGHVVGGFLAVVLGLGVVAVLLDPQVLSRYPQALRVTSPLQLAKLYNGSLIALAGRAGGGLAEAVAALAIVAAAVPMFRRADDEGRWLVAWWLSVAISPVVWLTTLLLLVPVYVVLWRNGSTWVRVLAEASAILPIMTALETPLAGWATAASVVLVGASLAVHLRNGWVTEPLSMPAQVGGRASVGGDAVSLSR